MPKLFGPKEFLLATSSPTTVNHLPLPDDYDLNALGLYEILLALIFEPFRRSIGASISTIIVPVGTNIATKIVTKILLASKADHTPRFQTR